MKIYLFGYDNGPYDGGFTAQSAHKTPESAMAKMTESWLQWYKHHDTWWTTNAKRDSILDCYAIHEIELED